MHLKLQFFHMQHVVKLNAIGVLDGPVAVVKPFRIMKQLSCAYATLPFVSSVFCEIPCRYCLFSVLGACLALLATDYFWLIE